MEKDQKEQRLKVGQFFKRGETNKNEIARKGGMSLPRQPLSGILRYWNFKPQEKIP